MTLLAVVGMAREAEIVGRGRACGSRSAAGARMGLARALEQALDADVTGLISIGIGGALDPDLSVGDVIIGTEVFSPDRPYPTHQAWTDALAAAVPAARKAAVWGSDAMVIDAGDKARLRDMTPARPSSIWRAISRPGSRKITASISRPCAWCRMPRRPRGSCRPAVLNGLKPDGRPNLLAGRLLGLAKRPGQLPALIRLGRDSEQAFKTLAEARAQAGPTFAYPIPRP